MAKTVSIATKCVRVLGVIAENGYPIHADKLTSVCAREWRMRESDVLDATGLLFRLGRIQGVGNRSTGSGELWVAVEK